MERYKTTVGELLAGMIVAEDVIVNHDHVLIPAGTKLTPRVIARLKFYSVEEIYVSGKVVGNSGPKNYFKNLESSIEFKRFNHTYKKSVDKFAENLNNAIQSDQEVDADKLLEEVDSIIEDSRNGLHLIQMMQCIRKYDDLTYVHCMNVALICNVIGEWLEFSREDTKLLMMAGLLHDIGKLVIPNEILTKPAKLTSEEYKVIKTHARKGYDLVKAKELDERVKLSILQHHERCDGSGYPLGLKGDQIADYAKIVAIADVYDAMTANRCYRDAICPFDVMEAFELDGFQKYDPKFLMPFLERISQCYIHSSVNLSNHQQGEVIMINQGEISRPIVKVDNEYIDLSHNPDVTIVGLA